jgi:hypothetical protein
MEIIVALGVDFLTAEHWMEFIWIIHKMLIPTSQRTLLPHYKDQSVNILSENTGDDCENRVK